MKKIITITHMTSVHTRYDTRIFVKECTSLAKVENFIVNLIVADGNGDEIRNNIHIHDIGKPSGRINRVLQTTKRVLNKAIELNSDIYHFHDPELMPSCLRLTRKGKKVIFDVHENIAEQIKDKYYLPHFARALISKSYQIYEKNILNSFTLILAETSYANYFSRITNDFTIVLNMPQPQFFESHIGNNRNKNELFYIGSVNENRGLYLILDALLILHNDGVSFKMHFVGPFDKININMEKYKAIENNVVFYGRLELEEGFKISENCLIGLSILKPIGNYITSYSTKIFEYMAVKLPVITSNFPLYQDIVEKYNCGLCVNPLDPGDIARGIQYIIDHPEEAQQMGENGKLAVEHQFNWDIERKKLFAVYNNLIDTFQNETIQSQINRKDT